MVQERKKTPNAQKWTEEKVMAHLDKLAQDMKGEYCYFLGWALKRQGLQKHVWSYWKQVFADNDDLLERMLIIDTYFEAKIVEAGLNNILPGIIATRTLKCAYGWEGSRSETIIHNKLKTC